MPLLRRLVPLAITVAIAGCYDSSGRDGVDSGGPGDFGCDCCGAVVLASGPAACPSVCAPYCSDGGVAPSCGARPLDLACFDHVSAGTATSIAIVAGSGDGCFCDQALACSARIAGDRTLAIDTQLCPEIPLCRACEPFAEGTCELPELTEGRWRVIVNGETALDLDVVPAGVIPEPGATCVRRALVDSCGAIWDPATFEIGRACMPTGVPEGSRAEIHVFDACGGCQQDGPCTVDVFDDVIRVRATRLSNGCDIACPPACFEQDHACLTPTLAAGEYRVTIDGVGEIGSLEVGPGPSTEPVCVGVARPL